MKTTEIKIAGTTREGGYMPRAIATLARGKDITCNDKTYAMVEATVMTPAGEETIVFCMDDRPGRTLQRAEDAKRLATILDGTDASYKTILQLIDVLKHMG